MSIIDWIPLRKRLAPPPMNVQLTDKYGHVWGGVISKVDHLYRLHISDFVAFQIPGEASIEKLVQKIQATANASECAFTFNEQHPFAKDLTMVVEFDLFSRSGKWKYSGTSVVPRPTNIYDHDVLDIIDAGQHDVTKGLISGRSMHCVVRLKDQPDCDQKFFQQLYPAKERESI